MQKQTCWNAASGASLMSNIKLKPPEFKKPGEYFVKTNTRILYEYSENGEAEKLQSRDFMNIFCPGGGLEALGENIWSWESPSRGMYEICFKKLNDDVKELERRLSNHKAVALKLPSGDSIFVKMDFPWQPVQQLTFRGVPTEYPLENLVKDLKLMNWGEIKTINAGRHKNQGPKWFNVRNNLLHIKMIDADLSRIPSVFWSVVWS